MTQYEQRMDNRMGGGGGGGSCKELAQLAFYFWIKILFIETYIEAEIS